MHRNVQAPQRVISFTGRLMKLFESAHHSLIISSTVILSHFFHKQLHASHAQQRNPSIHFLNQSINPLINLLIHSSINQSINKHVLYINFVDSYDTLLYYLIRNVYLQVQALY